MSFSQLIPLILPELVLIGVACALFLLGVSSRPAARRAAPIISLLTLAGICVWQITVSLRPDWAQLEPTDSIRITELATYVRMLASGVGALLVLLAWPTDAKATGNAALQFGSEAGEFFALLLLSISGIFLVAGANDIILLFLGIELASIPTYIMVSISRPLPAAQEAGVKYFFLGAMAAALMLFGFSYLYGTTGVTELSKMAEIFSATTPGTTPTVLTTWQMLGVIMLIAGFSFKIAAFPLHFYAGDVYEGAATPVTALLSFVPKTSGFVALIKLFFCISGGNWLAPEQLTKLLWFIAVLTMTVGNVVGLMQQNVKRTLAYSSIAHSGYMLVGLTVAMLGARQDAIQGVLFYLAAYGIMNVSAFGVLMLLPGKSNKPATSAETFEDLAGAGRTHPGLGLAMAVACFSLIGLPLTVGFFGKIYLIKPALQAGNLWTVWLVIIMLINAAISAGYYLRIVGVMFLRGEGVPYAPATSPAASGSRAALDYETNQSAAVHARPATAIFLAVVISTIGTLFFGIVFPATEVLHTTVVQPANVDTVRVTTSTVAQKQ
jgi:NADH-quinone oxidoreductase subunit N